MLRILFGLTIATLAFAATNLDYSHPKEWAIKNPVCNGKRQSPVNLDSKASKREQLEQGPIAEYGKWRLHATHFHNSLKPKEGSEHQIDGKRFDAELHLVHFNDKYETFKEALAERDGLAVLGILFEEADDTTPKRELISANQMINLAKRWTELKTKRGLDKLVDTGKFYRYLGSLTTPPCSENVLWTVFARPIKMTRPELEKLRKIILSKGESHNVRPVQQLFARTVEKSFD